MAKAVEASSYGGGFETAPKGVMGPKQALNTVRHGNATQRSLERKGTEGNGKEAIRGTTRVNQMGSERFSPDS